jgi:glycosyltransferase involved in cell wall biosynthesis
MGTNIGVNARRLEGQPLGVARYIEYLLGYWQTMLEPEESVTLFLRAPLEPGRAPQSPAFTTRVVRPKLRGFMWETLRLGPAARSVDVLFGPSYSLPEAYRGKTVVMIHSVNEVQEGTHPWWYPFTYTRIYRSSARAADRVIVPSESVKHDIQAAYGIPAAKIEIVPQGASDDFEPVEDEDLLRQTRIEQLGEDVPYIVFVGKLSQRRNIPMLIDAFGRLIARRPDLPHKLLLFGPNHLNLPLADLVEEHGVRDRVVQTDGVLEHHHDLTRIYSAADAYVSASAYEGFSITVVEAMACGTPVVGINRAAFGEIVDGAGHLIPEPTADGLADALEQVLTNPTLRAELSRRGLERAKAFRWEDNARRTLEILREVAAEGRR